MEIGSKSCSALPPIRLQELRQPSFARATFGHPLGDLALGEFIPLRNQLLVRPKIPNSFIQNLRLT